MTLLWIWSLRRLVRSLLTFPSTPSSRKLLAKLALQCHHRNETVYGYQGWVFDMALILLSTEELQKKNMSWNVHHTAITHSVIHMSVVCTLYPLYFGLAHSFYLCQTHLHQTQLWLLNLFQTSREENQNVLLETWPKKVNYFFGKPQELR